MDEGLWENKYVIGASMTVSYTLLYTDTMALVYHKRLEWPGRRYSIDVYQPSRNHRATCIATLPVNNTWLPDQRTDR